MSSATGSAAGVGVGELVVATSRCSYGVECCCTVCPRENVLDGTLFQGLQDHPEADDLKSVEVCNL